MKVKHKKSGKEFDVSDHYYAKNADVLEPVKKPAPKKAVKPMKKPDAE